MDIRKKVFLTALVTIISFNLSSCMKHSGSLDWNNQDLSSQSKIYKYYRTVDVLPGKMPASGKTVFVFDPALGKYAVYNSSGDLVVMSCLISLRSINIPICLPINSIALLELVKSFSSIPLS